MEAFLSVTRDVKAAREFCLYVEEKLADIRELLLDILACLYGISNIVDEIFNENSNINMIEKVCVIFLFRYFIINRFILASCDWIQYIKYTILSQIIQQSYLF